jgi:phospholipid/cholesterol/gamma-HCH transport system substrate-binding protein
LRSANTTLVNLRTTLQAVEPTVKLARPVAQPLAAFLTKLDPVARDARPLVARVRQTIDRPGNADLIGVLRGFLPLARTAVPAFDSAVSTVNDLLPVVKDLRPYAPDVVGGLQNGFGGATSGYYDANGHYTRISLQSSAYSLTSSGSLLPVPSAPSGLAGYQHGVNARCPGAATQPAPDHSNPWVVPGCDPKQGTP